MDGDTNTTVVTVSDGLSASERIRLECLKLAVRKDYSSKIETLDLAKAYERYVSAGR